MPRHCNMASIVPQHFAIRMSASIISSSDDFNLINGIWKSDKGNRKKGKLIRGLFWTHWKVSSDDAVEKCAIYDDFYFYERNKSGNEPLERIPSPSGSSEQLIGVRAAKIEWLSLRMQFMNFSLGEMAFEWIHQILFQCWALWRWSKYTHKHVTDWKEHVSVGWFARNCEKPTLISPRGDMRLSVWVSKT